MTRGEELRLWSENSGLQVTSPHEASVLSSVKGDYNGVYFIEWK